MRRPNILFAFADDWGRYASAYAAHHGERSLSALIDTPHFDRVAGEGNFRSFLADREPDQPFCYWWGPTNTHREWQKGSGKALWGLDPDALTGRLPAFLPDVHDVREDVCDYLGECMAVDRGLGVLLGMLEEMGELDDTLVVISGDHGIPGVPRGKCNLYDLGCEVALAARLPGTIPGGRVADDMVNLMDVAPTFLEVAGVEQPAGMPARSLMDVLGSDGSGQVSAERTCAVTGRERHVATARDRNLPYPHRAIRTHDFLYIRNFAPDRWPMGDPRGLDDPLAEAPPREALEHDTPRGLRGPGRESHQGVDDREPRGRGGARQVRAGLRQAAGGGALRRAQRPGPHAQPGRRSCVRGTEAGAGRTAGGGDAGAGRSAHGRGSVPVRG